LLLIVSYDTIILLYPSRGGESGQDRKVAALSLAFVVGKALFLPL
jgi:hypothetical protein